MFAGGKIRNAAGLTGLYSPRSSIARFYATSGELHPWAIPAGIIQNEDEVASDLVVTRERVTTGYLGPNFTRSYRLDDGDLGSLAWEKKSGGDVQTAALLGEAKLVIGGHFGQFDGAKRTRVALINLSDGTVDTSWAPDLTAANGFVSVWETFVDGDRVYIGGLFNTVAGSPRTDFARFAFTP